MSKIALISETVSYIESHLDEPLALTAVASGINYSKYYLHRTFAQTLGITIHDYVRKRRLTEAARLLTDTDQRILDIALATGFDNQQTFAALFKAMYKKTPGQFRNQHSYYPLQLALLFETQSESLTAKQVPDVMLQPAACNDIPAWMELVRLIIDGYPCFEEAEYITALTAAIRGQQAWLVKHERTVIANVIFNKELGEIHFIGIHPLYRRSKLLEQLLSQIRQEIERELSIVTFRQGDLADNGYRQELETLGFQARELVLGYDYPAQRMVLKG